MRNKIMLLLLSVLLGISTYILSCKPSHKYFTDDELDKFDDFFLSSIDLDKVIIKIDNYSHPEAIGNTIYEPIMKIEIYGRESKEVQRDLVHELVHVWQWQHYPVYLLIHALDDEIDSFVENDPIAGYKYKFLPEQHILDYKVEQQATLIADYYMRLKFGSDNSTHRYALDYESVGLEAANEISERRRQELKEVR